MSILVFKPTLLKSFHKRVKDRDKNLGLQNENQHWATSVMVVIWSNSKA